MISLFVSCTFFSSIFSVFVFHYLVPLTQILFYMLHFNFFIFLSLVSVFKVNASNAEKTLRWMHSMQGGANSS